MKRDDLRAGITWEEEQKAMTEEEMFEFMQGFSKRTEVLSH